jgi:hypothetical protein
MIREEIKAHFPCSGGTSMYPDIQENNNHPFADRMFLKNADISGLDSNTVRIFSSFIPLSPKRCTHAAI